jgi:hypothetical protein
MKNLLRALATLLAVALTGAGSVYLAGLYLTPLQLSGVCILLVWGLGAYETRKLRRQMTAMQEKHRTELVEAHFRGYDCCSARVRENQAFIDAHREAGKRWCYKMGVEDARQEMD